MMVEAAAHLAVRSMSREDIDAATELSREQNWPHREEDWELFLRLGEGIVAELDGKLVGTIMGWRFGEDMATLGMVIVTPRVQGKGIGRKLMEAMLARLAGCTIILNATEEGLPLYRKLGFVEIGRVSQHQGLVPPVPLVELMPGERVRPMGSADEGLSGLYSQASGMERGELFEALAEISKTVVLARDHHPAGFAMLRRFGRGWAIAPVVAPDAGGAKALITHWLGANINTFCRIDVTSEGDLSDWLEEIGLPCVGTVTTMALGPVRAADPDERLFALAAQALG